MNNEQCNRVHLDSGICEPDEPDQNNEGTIFLLLAVMEVMRKMNRAYMFSFQNL